MIEIEDKNNKVVFKGTKEEVINFFKEKGYKNIDKSTPILVLPIMINKDYNIYLR